MGLKSDWDWDPNSFCLNGTEVWIPFVHLGLKPEIFSFIVGWVRIGLHGLGHQALGLHSVNLLSCCSPSTWQYCPFLLSHLAIVALLFSFTLAELPCYFSHPGSIALFFSLTIVVLPCCYQQLHATTMFLDNTVICLPQPPPPPNSTHTVRHTPPLLKWTCYYLNPTTQNRNLTYV